MALTVTPCMRTPMAPCNDRASRHDRSAAGYCPSDSWASASMTPSTTGIAMVMVSFGGPQRCTREAALHVLQMMPIVIDRKEEHLADG